MPPPVCLIPKPVAALPVLALLPVMPVCPGRALRLRLTSGWGVKPPGEGMAGPLVDARVVGAGTLGVVMADAVGVEVVAGEAGATARWCRAARDGLAARDGAGHRRTPASTAPR